MSVGISKPPRNPEPAAVTQDEHLCLVDRLLGRLRVSEPPAQFQAQAVLALRAELRADAAAWVPTAPNDQVIVDGAIDGLSPDSWRLLIPEGLASPEGSGEGPPPTGLPVSLARVALAADDLHNAPVGRLIAVQRRPDAPFTTEHLQTLRSVANLIASQRYNASRYDDLKDLLFGIIRAMVWAIDAKDPYTAGHSERVARIAVRLGQELGLSPVQRGDLYLMGLLHDVGKIGVEDSVLKKAGRLTEAEYRAIQEHVKIGVRILSDMRKLRHILPGVAYHHERIDGNGYPSGLAGDDIPLAARILAVADAFDAMSSSRPYRRGLSPSRIDEILREGMGTQWDARVVAALLACRDEVAGIHSRGVGESLQIALKRTLGRGEPPRES